MADDINIDLAMATFKPLRKEDLTPEEWTAIVEDINRMVVEYDFENRSLMLVDDWSFDPFERAWEIKTGVVENCDVCRRFLDNPPDRFSPSCGGTCLACIKVMEEPDKYRYMYCEHCQSDCVIEMWKAQWFEKCGQQPNECIEWSEMMIVIQNPTNPDEIERNRIADEEWKQKVIAMTEEEWSAYLRQYGVRFSPHTPKRFNQEREWRRIAKSERKKNG